MTSVLSASRLKTYASFVKLEHTVFSLPLVLAGTLIHTRAWPGAALFTLILLAAVGGRVMAMGLNRIIDARIDERNPRTRAREIPRGAMRRSEAWFIVAVAALLYVGAAAAIANICVWLSPIPVALFVIYPYLKRFTMLTHLGLGLAWSMATLGGWLAAAQSLKFIGEVWALWLFSVLWVAGFDIIYATMDEAFDKSVGLHSLPAQIGRSSALWVARAMHLFAFLSLCVLWVRQPAAPSALVWLGILAVLFVWQHLVAKRNPEFAFFKINAAAGFVVLGFVFAGA